MDVSLTFPLNNLYIAVDEVLMSKQTKSQRGFGGSICFG